MKHPQHDKFLVQEFVSKDVFEKWGKYAARKVAPQILEVVFFLRDFLNAPIIINTWHNGGKFDSRGFRSEDDPDGSAFSAHKCGLALDFQVIGFTPVEIVALIDRLKSSGAFPYVTRAENPEITKTWVHIDAVHVEGLSPRKLYVFNP